MTGMEQAARALAELEGGNADWGAMDAASKEQFKTLVRTILNALREPDIRMMEAGAQIVRHVGGNESEEALLSDAANVWRFMIDVLLGEKIGCESS